MRFKESGVKPQLKKIIIDMPSLGFDWNLAVS